jgi:hypothetical protein
MVAGPMIPGAARTMVAGAMIARSIVAHARPLVSHSTTVEAAHSTTATHAHMDAAAATTMIAGAVTSTTAATRAR